MSDSDGFACPEVAEPDARQATIMFAPRDASDQTKILKGIEKLLGTIAERFPGCAVSITDGQLSISVQPVSEQLEAVIHDAATEALEAAERQSAQEATPGSTNALATALPQETLSLQSGAIAGIPSRQSQSRLWVWFHTWVPKRWRFVCDAGQLAGNIAKVVEVMP